MTAYLSSVVMTVCQMLSPIPEPLCHEVIVARSNMSVEICVQNAERVVMSPANPFLTEYSDAKWTITKIGCADGKYELRDAA